MRRLIFLWFAFRLLLAQNGEQHEFVIANFRTESGATLPQARIVYGTYGQLKLTRATRFCSPPITWPTFTVMSR